MLPKKIMIIAQLICPFLLISCVSSVPLKPQDKVSLKNVSICSQVQMPEEMYYKGPEQQLSAYGLIGDIAASYYEMTNKEKIKYLMDQHNIDVSQIVREQFTEELERNGIFNAVVPEGGDGEIKLWVRIYGFAYELSGDLKPMMGIEGSLLRSDGSICWQKYAYITNFCDQTPGYSIEQFTNNPESLRQAFKITTELIAQELVAHMQGN